MLYHLFTSLIEEYSFLNIFTYLTVRTGLAMFTAMLVIFVIGTPFINFFSKKQIHDPIRKDGPEKHILKKLVHLPWEECYFNWSILWDTFME